MDAEKEILIKHNIPFSECVNKDGQKVYVLEAKGNSKAVEEIKKFYADEVGRMVNKSNATKYFKCGTTHYPKHSRLNNRNI